MTDEERAQSRKLLRDVSNLLMRKRLALKQEAPLAALRIYLAVEQLGAAQAALEQKHGTGK